MRFARATSALMATLGTASASNCKPREADNTAVQALSPGSLAIDDRASIAGVAKTLASGVMSYYAGTAQSFVDLPKPYYWWECGALTGAMLDYARVTGDTTYADTVATALMANVGPAYDFMVPAHRGDEGNDDQAFWAFAVLAAAEYDVAQPDATKPAGMPAWTDVAANVWNTMAGRWNASTCGGGLSWQIFADNFNGLNYKNTAANGGFFHISARLAKLTGNQTYVDWAARAWDWCAGLGLIDADLNVYDGTDSAANCVEINKLSFTYQAGIFLHGAAALANHTGDALWADRAAGLLRASSSFFTFDNATNVMFEHACEGVGTCTVDAKSFKGYLSRGMYAAAGLVPALKPQVAAYMQASAQAAAQACTGTNVDGAPSPDGSTCGQKWYVGGFDGSVGLGQQMSALETIQGLLVLDDIPDAAPPPASSAPPVSSTTSVSSSTVPMPSSSAAAPRTPASSAATPASSAATTTSTVASLPTQATALAATASLTASSPTPVAELSTANALSPLGLLAFLVALVSFF